MKMIKPQETCHRSLPDILLRLLIFTHVAAEVFRRNPLISGGRFERVL